MPSQDCVRRYQRRHVTQHLSSEAAAVGGKSTPLGLGQLVTGRIEVSA
jgi:hypothetical protein